MKLFDDKLQNCRDDEQRKKIETLKETTNSLVESIKHYIISLQIAKSTINPVDAIYQPGPLEAVVNTVPSQTVLPPEPTQRFCKSEQCPSSLPVGPVLTTLGHHQTPTPNSTGSGHSPPSSSLTSPSHVNLSPNTFPEFSYSSNEDEFYDDLASAKAVICNGGFTFISESIHLKKPISSVPAIGNFEQTLNAFYVQKLGYGEYHETIDAKRVSGFLKRLPVYKKRLAKVKKTNNDAIVRELIYRIEKYSKLN